MRAIIDAFRGEYARYKQTAEGALEQLSDDELSLPPPGAGNSAAAIVWHVSGNLSSRFTDLLTSDGEKPWRDRESEFEKRAVSRAELTARWERGWGALFSALEELDDGKLGVELTIRGQPLTVREALVRSLSHTASHVGQLVFLAKSIRGAAWRWLSIPPGQSSAYTAAAAAGAAAGGRAGSAREKAPSPPSAIAGELAERIVRCFTGPMWHGPSISQALDGVSASAAAAHPVAGAHSIAELVRHTVTWAEVARARLGGRGDAEPTDAENWPPGGPGGEEAWKGEQAALEASYRALAAEVRVLTSAQLAATIQGRPYSAEDMIRGVVEHGLYHAGQIALLRRALGIGL